MEHIERSKKNPANQDSTANPYEDNPGTDYDLQSIRLSEENELSDLLEDKSLSREELESALRGVRLKYLYVVCLLFALLGAFGLIFGIRMFQLHYRHFSDYLFGGFSLVFSLLPIFSSLGLSYRKKWGFRLGILTAWFLVFMFPIGTFLGLFALTSIRDCEPEFA